LPDAAANIATFVLPGRQQLGIGSALFTTTERAGRDLGYVWINATIRADNEGGLVYYQSRGFRIWKRETGVEIAPGRVVDRLCTRYDLD
jgi:GNAT superfamily N-acetyltransferase